MGERLVPIKEVMQTFGISRTTVARWIDKGCLVQRKLECSNKAYFTESSVQRLLEGAEQ